MKAVFFFIPGVPQLLEGRYVMAVAWFLFIPLCYLVFWPGGVLVHLGSILSVRNL